MINICYAMLIVTLFAIYVMFTNDICNEEKMYLETVIRDIRDRLDAIEKHIEK